jgi:colanic acid biosynthesis glycosyl transferase WcaI
MKFIIHTQYYPPEIGAPQNRLSELAERLVKCGHRVTVLTAIPNYPLGKFYPSYGGILKREVRNGVSVIRAWIYPTKSVSLLRRLSNYFSFVFSSLFIGSLLLPKADYLLTESPPLFLGISGYLLSRLKMARWIFNVSDLWPESAVRLGIIGKGLPLKLSERLEAFCYRKANLVTGQSREILKGIEKKVPGTRIYHFSNGVNSSMFTPEMRSTTLHQKLGGGAECVAVYAGLHGIAQGLEQVIDAARIIQDLEGKLKIVFIGDGPEKESLVKRALGLNIITFLPPRPKEKISGILASSDIALVPLKTYIPGAVPSKLYEAMASALPVILVAEGEPTDILDESHAGISISPGKVEGIAQALRKLTMDKELRKRLGRNGRLAVRERFDRQRIVADFLHFLEENHANL